MDVKVDFTPALENPLNGNEPTPAQAMGWQFFAALSGVRATAQAEDNVTGNVGDQPRAGSAVTPKQ